MWAFLSSIDPNVLFTIGSAIVTLGVFAYHKIRGDKTDDFSSLIGDVVGNIAHELLDTYAATPIAMQDLLDNARRRIESVVWPVLAKRGIPRNALTEKLLAAAIESSTKWLANEIAARRIPAQLRELSEKLAQLPGAFVPRPTVAVVPTPSEAP